MPNVILDEQVLMDIAAEIRAWNGTSTRYKPNQMGDAIRNIDTTRTRISVNKSTSTSKVMLKEESLIDIASAIKSKVGSDRKYYPYEMAWAIKNLDKIQEEAEPGGGIEPLPEEYNGGIP